MLLPVRLLLAIVRLPIRLFFKLPLRLMLEIKLIVLGFLAGVGVGVAIHVRDAYRTWGLADGEAELELTGDDVVPDAELTDTRSLAIAAPPADVWPWPSLGPACTNRRRPDGSRAAWIRRKWRSSSSSDMKPRVCQKASTKS